MKYYFNTMMLPLVKGSICIFILLNISSCKLFSRVIWKVKSPKVESINSLTKYLNKNDYESSKMILFKDLSSFALFDKKYNMSVPEAYFINNSGEFVEYKKTPEQCNAAVDEFILDIEEINMIHPENNTKLSDVNELLNTPIVQDNEIIILMTWAVYAGKINTTHSLDWINLVKTAQEKGVKINYYLLNCDFLDTWGVDPTELKKSSKKSMKEGIKEGK